ncbi:MAG: hypothetical protein ABSE15_00975 [Candidatus Bathyarchaeia archaeon]|jgi:DNA-binding MarR family transcriptional regulator
MNEQDRRRIEISQKRREKIAQLIDEIFFLNSDTLEILKPEEEPKDALNPFYDCFERNGIKYTINLIREKA